MFKALGLSPPELSPFRGICHSPSEGGAAGPDCLHLGLWVAKVVWRSRGRGDFGKGWAPWLGQADPQTGRLRKSSMPGSPTRGHLQVKVCGCSCSAQQLPQAGPCRWREMSLPFGGRQVAGGAHQL